MNVERRPFWIDAILTCVFWGVGAVVVVLFLYLMT